MMRKSPMGLFFNDASPDFMPRWKTIRKKGFRWFYVRRVPRVFLFMAVIYIVSSLLNGHFPVLGGDLACILTVSIVFAAVVSFLMWKKYEGTYRRKAEKRQALHGGKG